MYMYMYLYIIQNLELNKNLQNGVSCICAFIKMTINNLNSSKRKITTILWPWRYIACPIIPKEFILGAMTINYKRKMNMDGNKPKIQFTGWQKGEVAIGRGFTSKFFHLFKNYELWSYTSDCNDNSLAQKCSIIQDSSNKFCGDFVQIKNRNQCGAQESKTT